VPAAQGRLRPIRGRPHPSRALSGSKVRVPSAEWIPIPVPAIVDPELFEAAGAQLEENRQRKRDGRRRPGWLLQGLVVCRRCGYAFYGKMARGTVGGHQPADYGYYRCIGTDAHKFGGQAPCDNRSVRSDKLEAVVWREVLAVLDNPQRIAAEHERRTAAARDGEPHAASTALERQIARLQRKHAVITAWGLLCRRGERSAVGSTHIGDDLAQVFHAVSGEGGHAVLADTVDPQTAVFREHADRQVEDPLFVFAEQSGDIADRIDGAERRHDQAARLRAAGFGRQFQGSSSSIWRAGCPAMRARTSASQACGSTSFSLAVTIRL
jgi:hypothetical protein